jgi:hypothetical protein
MHKPRIPTQPQNARETYPLFIDLMKFPRTALSGGTSLPLVDVKKMFSWIWHEE